MSADPTPMTPEQAHAEMMAVEDMHPDARVRRDDPNSRYVIDVDGKEAGFAAFNVEDHKTVFVHTVIDPNLEGEGLGSQLARGALDDVRERDGTVVALCPFIAAWIARHPDYESLVDHDADGRLDQP